MKMRGNGRKRRLKSALKLTSEDRLSLSLGDTGVWGFEEEEKGSAGGEKDGESNDAHDWVSL